MVMIMVYYSKKILIKISQEMHDAEYKTTQSMKFPVALSTGNLEDNFPLQQRVIVRMGHCQPWRLTRALVSTFH